MPDVQLLPGDCLALLPTLPSQSVDLILTSPPYDDLRKYGTFDFAGVAKQLVRVLRQGGVLVWVVADQTVNGSETGTSFQHALAFKELGLRLHDTMIYAKLNPMPLNHNRYEQAFEYMFVFAKGKPATVNKLTEPCANAGRINNGTQRHNLQDLTPKHGAGKPYKASQPRKNIWWYGVGTERVSGHPAIFPLQLAKDHILSWSNPGDAVLDPFAGSGTTGVATIETGRDAILIERDPGYCEIITRRLASAQSALPEAACA